jgi:hypothetical protein
MLVLPHVSVRINTVKVRNSLNEDMPSSDFTNTALFRMAHRLLLREGEPVFNPRFTPHWPTGRNNPHTSDMMETQPSFSLPHKRFVLIVQIFSLMYKLKFQCLPKRFQMVSLKAWVLQGNSG